MAHIPLDELLRIAELLFNEYSVVARKGTADTTEPLEFPNNSIAARISSGDLSALAFAQNTLLGRRTGDLDDLPAGDARGILDVSPRAIQTLSIVSDEVDYDVSNGVNAVLTLDQDVDDLTLKNPVEGMRGILQVIQDGSGGHVIWALSVEGGSVKFPNGSPPSIATDPNDISLLEWYYDGTDAHVVAFSIDSK
jgi:hypothetical protein